MRSAVLAMTAAARMRSAHAPWRVLCMCAQPLMVGERPPVKPSGKRAQFIDKLVPPPLAAPPPSVPAAVGMGAGAADAPPPPRPELYNRVVRIDGEDAHPYWYVLTFLPDLQWCHVAPLTQRGVFVEPSPSAGRPRWMLVSEEEGGEIDVGAGRCHIMRALEMKKTQENADEEEWDILDD
eukprot:2931555-Prymnesium_polylepis.1